MRAYATLLVTLLFSLPVLAADKPATDKERLSYTIGQQIGQNLKNDNLNLDVNQLNQAIKDALEGRASKLSNEEMQQALMKLQQQKQQEMMAMAESNRKKGDDYLAKHRKGSGVQETATGLQYKVLSAGTGKKPTANDTVVVHYRGTLIDGTEFDSSYKRGEPATFPVQGVIKGWQEALQLMPQGSKWQVVIPANLAYGPRGAGPSIGPNSTLVFEMELLEIK